MCIRDSLIEIQNEAGFSCTAEGLQCTARATGLPETDACATSVVEIDDNGRGIIQISAGHGKFQVCIEAPDAGLLPVWTLPIEVIAENGTVLYERTEMERHVQFQGNEVTVVEDRTALSEGSTGGMVWDAGLVLCRYLAFYLEPGSWQGKRVLELGSGTGLVGLCAAQLGGDVTVTDLPGMCPLLERNAAGSTVSVKPLQWGEQTEFTAQSVDVVPRVRGGL
eukprot:TRINITY_DN12683_c0_g1_i2.p1 TRINITY_DN12683_c0_g1~~TRINITY_DN12683_c0_g1_i2.p1  ORF type:complete len:222 (+),score=47.44 TRINITY_DN12683_c0_g1_i2:131-796(+)